ncbi:hypothetical protein K2173_009957 [Erythroxylum novogranatense]|uniref:Uncharacterized protein n=1 Tax=Erythroxylum novogranatense TaxID=1862640 RepID=A0AAV8T0C5_9ROSI|nr:hypothetical protein K2173_009957 [Erythroxylum novogranatense]
MASRYNSFDSRSSAASSNFSDPSSSTELTSAASRALVKSKPSELSKLSKVKSNGNGDHNNLSAMMKTFMSKKGTLSGTTKGSSKNPVGLVIPADVIAEDLKKTARKGTSFVGLQKKLFGKEKEKKREVKALTEVKGGGSNGNTRTLAMVLRSERELLTANKDLETEIAELKLKMEDKNRELEKLKDLCLKQREDIKSLKNAILFPDAMNSQLQDLLEQQGSELKQAKQLIPTLQKQVTSLTGQLKCLADDLAEVKADKYGRPVIPRYGSSPMTPTYDYEEATNSLEFSSSGDATPGSPDDLFLKDLNPCLTPYCAKTKSKEFEAIGYDSSVDHNLSKSNTDMTNDLSFDPRLRKVSKSSDGYRGTKPNNRMPRSSRRSNESKGTYGKATHIYGERFL